jgi:hypothetical protein
VIERVTPRLPPGASGKTTRPENHATGEPRDRRNTRSEKHAITTRNGLFFVTT